MKTMITHRPTWLRGLLAVLVCTPLLLALPSCTDLDEEPFGVITPDQFFNTEAEFLAGIAPVYAQLRNTLGDYHNVSEHTSDEILVPTRGGDWGDGGIWRALHQHTWGPDLPQLNGAWVGAYTGIARANTVLDALANSSTELESAATFEAELRTLRAFFYYQLLDFFGNVPIVTEPAVDPENPPSNASRAEVFDFIESELQAALPNLVTQQPADQYGRVEKGAALAMLARMYLNAPVWQGQARWQDAINTVDEILNLGVYQLSDDYFDNFRLDNENSPELLFVVAHLPKGGLGFNFSMRVLHYNQLPAGAATPWNGFATLADHFNMFDDDDVRKDIFLVGQQFESPNAGCIGNECFSQGAPLKDRNGNNLVFTPEIPGLILTDPNAIETAGVRVLKWEIDPAQSGGDAGNDYAFFRLADMYLIKAEALNEMGNTGQAVQLVNLIRERAFEPDEPIPSSVSQSELRNLIHEERAFELTNEMTRRQDLIRFETVTGQRAFTADWQFKDPSAIGQDHLMLFPIPQPQLDANPNLTQNTGY